MVLTLLHVLLYAEQSSSDPAERIFSIASNMLTKKGLKLCLEKLYLLISINQNS